MLNRIALLEQEEKKLKKRMGESEKRTEMLLKTKEENEKRFL